MLDRPRHTQQLDYFIYEHDMRTKEIPAGPRARAPGRRGAARAHERRAERRPRATAGDRPARGARPPPAQERAASTSINIADISRRAGVTRSAFYFYFENKASRGRGPDGGDVRRVAGRRRRCLRGDGDPAERVEADGPRRSSTRWERHEHIYRAMLDARATSPAVRELWDNDRESFVPVVAAVIEAERAAGRGARRARRRRSWRRCCSSSTTGCWSGSRSGGPLRRDEHVDAVVDVWLRTHLREAAVMAGRIDVRRASTFVSGGADVPRLALRRRAATPSRPTRGRPVVVMAHGLGRHQGLRARAVRRGAGRGRARRARLRLPRLRRQRGRRRASGVDVAGQVEDYRAAMAAAARPARASTRSRLVLWGVSLAGGHVLAAAAHRDDVAAVVALTPLVDGMAAGRHALPAPRAVEHAAVDRSPASAARSPPPSAAAR